jgi:hypothetical protein
VLRAEVLRTVTCGMSTGCVHDTELNPSGDAASAGTNADGTLVQVQFDQDVSGCTAVATSGYSEQGYASANADGFFKTVGVEGGTNLVAYTRGNRVDVQMFEADGAPTTLRADGYTGLFAVPDGTSFFLQLAC